MSEEVIVRLRDAIRDHGPITFAEFMEHALYGPGGFYADPPVGPSGHFVTSPHVHPVFGDLVRFALLEARDALGRPEPLRVVELGAGDGTLARQLLVGFEAGGVAVEYVAVEVSRGARERLRELPIQVLDAVGQLPPLDPGVVLANELLDNLPFRLLAGRAEGPPAEIRIDLRDGRPVEVEVPCDEDLAAALARDDPARASALGPGERAVVPTGADALIGEVAGALRHGYALFVDYGSVDGPAGEVHGYRRHTVLEDVLEEPGSADVTAGVDLGWVAARAEAAGLVALGNVSQAHALRSLGYDRWATEELGRQAELLRARRGLEAVRAWEGRSRASLLVDPAALGRLRWLLLATPGLPRPGWLVAALGAGGPSALDRSTGTSSRG